MLKQKFSRMKKVLAILLSVLFIASVTAVAASAHGGGGGWGGMAGAGAMALVVGGWVVIIGFARDSILHLECHIPFKLQHLPSQPKLQIQVQILQEQLYFQKHHQKIQEHPQLPEHPHLQIHLLLQAHRHLEIQEHRQLLKGTIFWLYR